jgi:hypothetical protein
MAAQLEEPNGDATVILLTPLSSLGDSMIQRTRQTRLQSLSAVAADIDPASPEASTRSQRPMEEPLSTPLCLQNFGKVLERNKLRVPEIEAEKRHFDMLAATARKGHQPPETTLAQLREWAHPTPKNRLQKTLMPVFPGFGRPPRPNERDLEHLANHYFPRRGELKIRICDFGDERVEYSEKTLEDLDSCMYSSQMLNQCG